MRLRHVLDWSPVHPASTRLTRKMLPRRIRSSRYNSFIWHVSLIKSGGPSVHPIGVLRSRSDAPPLATSPARQNRVWVSTTLKKREGVVGFIRPDDLYGYDPSHTGKDKEHLYIYVYNNIYVAPCMRAAWVRVALPCGLACHVAPARVPRLFCPFFIIF